MSLDEDNYNYVQTARILFDSCSQKSFIKSDLRQRLKLKTIRTENLMIKAFGSTEEKIQTLDIVNVKMFMWQRLSGNRNILSS